eukprot:tig00021441_g21542.t1
MDALLSSTPEQAALAELVAEWERFRAGGVAPSKKAYALCISPGVTALLGAAAAEHDGANERVLQGAEAELLLSRGLLDWSFVRRALGSAAAAPPPADIEDVAAREAEAAAFRHAARSVASAARHAHDFLADVDAGRLRELYGPQLEALGDRRATVELLYSAHRSGQHALAFPGLVALLERVLSDLYYRDQPGSAPPHLLKELLVSECARAALGEDAIFALRCFVGPPTGLNLRNIVWHGFLSSSELDATFSSLLFVVFFTVISAVSAGPRGPRPAFARTPASFEPHAAALRREGLPPLPLPSPTRLRRLVSNSLFVLGGRESDLLAALEDFRAGRSLQSIVRLLPLLEMCLRRIFVAENGLPLGAMWAESCALYTTLDDVLGAGVCFTEAGERNGARRAGGGGPFAGPRTGGRPNLLRPAIGEGLVWALYDAVLAYDGPRLRDRVAHGETVEGGVPPEVSELLVGATVALCARFEPPAAGEGCEEPELESIAAHFRGYRSAFHPLSILRRAIEDAEEEAGRLGAEVGAALAARPVRHSCRLLDADQAEYFELAADGSDVLPAAGAKAGPTLSELAARAAELCASLRASGGPFGVEARECSAEEHAAIAWMLKAAEELSGLVRVLRDRVAEAMPLALARSGWPPPA